jgi:hypothetical protein
MPPKPGWRHRSASSVCSAAISQGEWSLRRVNYLTPFTSDDAIICGTHLFGGVFVAKTADTSAKSWDRQTTNLTAGPTIVFEDRNQRRPHGQVSVDGTLHASGNAHRWSGYYKWKTTHRQFDHQSRADWQLAEIMFGYRGHYSTLRFTLVEIVDGFVDSATHVAEAIRWANDSIAIRVEQIAADYLDARYIMEFRR